VNDEGPEPVGIRSCRERPGKGREDAQSPPLITERYDPKGRTGSEAEKSSAMPSWGVVSNCMNRVCPAKAPVRGWLTIRRYLV